MVTSSVVSSAQLTIAGTPPQAAAFDPGGGVVKRSVTVFIGQLSALVPVQVDPQSIVRVVEGRPNVVSNVFRSLWTVGLPNASTMTIVWPLPSTPPRPPLGGKLYAFLRNEGGVQRIVPRLTLEQNGTPPTGANGLNDGSISVTTELTLAMWRSCGVVARVGSTVYAKTGLTTSPATRNEQTRRRNLIPALTRRTALAERTGRAL